MSSIREQVHKMIDELSDEELQRWLMELWKTLKMKRTGVDNLQIGVALGDELPSVKTIFQTLRESNIDGDDEG